jgi:hypothetical protein
MILGARLSRTLNLAPSVTATMFGRQRYAPFG